MRDKAFLDTNVLIYLYTKDDESKRNTVYGLLDDNSCAASVQVLNEVSNVMLKKFSLSSTQIREHLDNIELVCDEMLPVHRGTIDNALAIKDRYGFSYFDSLMLASALDGDCQIIFTEDMSDGQLINDTLRIVDPFKQELKQ